MKYKILFIATFFSAIVSAQSKYTLESFVGEMLEKDFGIQIRRNEAEIAENNNNPGNAGYLPSVLVTADQNWSSNNTRQEFFSGQVNQAAGAKNRSTNAVARLNWTFFDGFRMFATDKRLDLLEDVATMNLTAEMEMKVYQASALFFTLLQQEKMSDVYVQALELSRARYDLVELKTQNGAASELELIQARLDLTEDSSAYLINLKTIENLKADMNQFLARDPLAPLEVEGEIIAPVGLEWSRVQQDALAQNTSILLAKSAIAIREQERREVQSLYYPQLSFYSQYVYGNSQSQIGLVNSNRSYGPGVGFTLRWSILDRLATYTAVRNNQLQIESAEIVAQQQELTVQTELRKAFNEYEWAQRNLALEQQNIRQSELSFSIAQNAYENGSITDLELREIQFSIMQAQSRYLQAELQLKTAELNIALTTGNFKSLLN